jgi:hypothetical protein
MCSAVDISCGAHKKQRQARYLDNRLVAICEMVTGNPAVRQEGLMAADEVRELAGGGSLTSQLKDVGEDISYADNTDEFSI